MIRNITLHWLLQVVAHRATARAWIDCGNRGSNAVTSRDEAAKRARENLRYSRQSAAHFVESIGERRRELMESGVAV